MSKTLYYSLDTTGRTTVKEKFVPWQGVGQSPPPPPPPKKKLSNHLQIKHPEIGQQKRRILLQSAKTAPKKYVPQVCLQQKLKFGESCRAPSEPDEPHCSSEPGCSSEPSCFKGSVASSPNPTNKKGTNSMPLFSPTNPSMAIFKRYLMSLDGKRRKEHVAHAICRDVGKILHFCNPSKPTWVKLTNREKVMSYIEELKTRGMTLAGQLTKLERLCDALAYGEKYSMSLLHLHPCLEKDSEGRQNTAVD